MKNNQLAVMLVGVLLLSALVNSWLTYSYVSSVHKMRMLQPELNQMTVKRSILQSLLNEVIEYGKTHKDVEALVQSLGNKTVAKPGAAPAVKAPAK